MIDALTLLSSLFFNWYRGKTSTSTSSNTYSSGSWIMRTTITSLNSSSSSSLSRPLFRISNDLVIRFSLFSSLRRFPSEAVIAFWKLLAHSSCIFSSQSGKLSYRVSPSSYQDDWHQLLVSTVFLEVLVHIVNHLNSVTYFCLLKFSELNSPSSKDGWLKLVLLGLPELRTLQSLRVSIRMRD